MRNYLVQAVLAAAVHLLALALLQLRLPLCVALARKTRKGEEEEEEGEEGEEGEEREEGEEG